jgi:hypothetical protein
MAEQDREMIPVLLFSRAVEMNLPVAEFVRILFHMGILTNSAVCRQEKNFPAARVKRRFMEFRMLPFHSRQWGLLFN